MKKTDLKLGGLLTLFIILSGMLASAQFNPEAQKYLDDAVAQLHSGKGLKLKYTVSEVTNSSDLPFAEGVLYLLNEAYRLESDDMQVFFTGKEQWIYNTDAKELMIQSVDTSQMDDSNPISVLKKYNTGYKYDIEKETDEIIVINMVSQNQFNPYLLVTVKINKLKNEVVSLQMLMHDESALKIDLQYLNKNMVLDSAFFDFKDKGFEVSDTIDLRD